MGLYTGVGRVLSATKKTANNGLDILNISVSVNTGERKREGEAYKPSQIFELSIFGKRAVAVASFLRQKALVEFSGLLTAPYLYLSGDEPKCKQQIIVGDVFEIVSSDDKEQLACEVYNSSVVREEASKETSERKSNVKSKKNNEEDDIAF